MISIIIPAHNEEEYIEKTLKSIIMQDYSYKEIIVVCNGCSDKTSEIAKKYTNKVFELKEPNIAKARNFGATKAKGKKLLFLDADTYFLNKGTLKKIMQHNAVIGTCKGQPDKRDLKFKLFFALKNNLLWKGWVNGLTFCNKEVFEKVNGYDSKKQPYENRDLIKKFRKFGKFKVINDNIITSMRRYERWGFRKTIVFWLKNLIKKEKYEIIR
jgi:glycosyltransferase involved in cell wall biosynthesis